MKTLVLILLQLAATGADAYYTDRGMGRNPLTHVNRETNPIARPFVQTRADRIAYFSVTAGIKIAVPRLIHKKHPKLATAAEIAAIVDSAEAAAYSGTH